MTELELFISSAAPLDPVVCGVVHPCDEVSLMGAIESMQAGMIEPVLIGPEARIRAEAEKASLSLRGARVINADHSHHAAEIAAELAANGKVEGLMKGSLHTDELMHAILAAVETINPSLVSTLDAAALCKMADRGQIVGGQVDGPLAFDTAISIEAARVKGIKSEVAGQPDVLVVPDLESGNMLIKQLEYLAGAAGAGIVIGARVPVALTSRADPAASRVASAALLKLVAYAYRLKRP